MTRFAALEDLRNRPIGDQGPARAARKSFRTRIPIQRDNALFGEALVETRERGLKGENFYASDRNPPYWHRVEGATDKLLLRPSVADKLLRIDARASKAGLELFLMMCTAASPGGPFILPRDVFAAALDELTAGLSP